MAKNRKCICCGETYSYCPSCSRVDALEPVWKSEFCNESCMSLWDTLTKYNMGFLTKDEAKDIISNLSLKPIGSYVSCVQRDYNKVMAEEKKPRRLIKKIEPVVEPEIITEQFEVSIPMAIEPDIHEVVLKEDE